MHGLSKSATARAEWRDGWQLVVSSGAGMALTSPLMVYSMGLFIGPLEDEFGWSRALITSGLTVNAVVAVICSGLIGILVDRFGPRRVAIPGTIIYCATFAGLSAATGSSFQWWALWAAVALGSLLVSPTVWTAAIASRFDASRGLAIASTSFGQSLGGLLAPLWAGFLIAAYGWRWGYVGLALVWLLAILPLLIFWFRGASDIARTTSLKRSAEIVNSPLAGVGLREALRSPIFYRLAFASMLIMLVLTSSAIHFVPIVSAAGLDRATAVTLASVIGFSSILGRIFSGVMLDRFHGTWVGGLMFLFPAFAFLGLLMFTGSTPLAIVIALLIGFASGAEMETAAYLTSRYFGMRSYGSLYGLIIGMLALALGFGPMIAGYVYDQVGSYGPALLAGIPISLLASLLIFTLGPYPDFANGDPEGKAQ